ncbi:NAD(P)H-dependent oxidoreductase [Streptomyces spinosirectus]|jgi:FMN-dependent NADH-azoreductase|uniref:FMN-dependent NADH-azoreductase n=1 Tax=Streptomyces TaxID=1883 RepID=UPI000D336CD1|nr:MULTISPECIES: NAD(P)H-dependent oxidoreductase [Streptomyces]MBY8344025.1 NAD(P)H-dependent oxidoreductase [Streptomyces plumbidurans]PTM92969.1 FMN-dependent NADH-azoreductase [Streptomyces sp. VMFN-G11Ma]UIR15576.1 NAD(P)H-dependent oxidoreductase [Streptomyces spinosirectus]
MNLFRLDASILPSASTTAEIADIIETEWTAAHPGATVTRRHLGTDTLPADAWTLATTAGFTPEGERTPAQREALALGAALAEEVQNADAAVVAVPLYNYGVSQHFKAWVDLVIAGAGPTTPLLKDTPTVLVTSLGGGYGPGTPREGWDHSTPYLQRILADVWEADLAVIKRELTLAATAPGMESLRDLAAQLHTDALAAARETGKTLARR